MNTTKDNNLKKPTPPNFSKYKIETYLDLPQLYLPGTGGSVINTENRAIRVKLKENLDNITSDLNDYMNGLIKCNDTYVNDYNLCIKQMLLYLSNNNFYGQTDDTMPEGQLNLNFLYLPILCQAYLVSNTNSNFNSNEQTIFKNYISKMYYLINNNMMSASNNLKIGYGRLGFLCFFITNNNNMYKDGMNVLNYAISKCNDDGTIETEMGRQKKSYIYNNKSANFICDLFYFRNTELSQNEFNKIKLVTNLILDTFEDSTDYTDGRDLYSKKTRYGPQEMVGSGLGYLNYKFIINTLSDSNKIKVIDLYNKRRISTNPFAIGE